MTPHVWHLIELAGLMIGGTIGFLIVIRLLPERWFVERKK